MLMGLNLERLVQALGEPDGDHAGRLILGGVAGAFAELGEHLLNGSVLLRLFESDKLFGRRKHLADEAIRPEYLAKEVDPVSMTAIGLRGIALNDFQATLAGRRNGDGRGSWGSGGA